MSYAIVFPGQGAQQTGMGRDLYDEFPAARAAFESADDALGFRLSEIIFEGPEEKLQQTAFTQPAILTMSIAVFRALTIDKGFALSPVYMAGHSLGEYTALVASGALSLKEGVRLVHLRGKLMQDAVPMGQGAMAAIIGLLPNEVVSLCEEASEGKVCQAANFNSPGQTVISGHTEAIERAVSIAKQKGAKRAVMLKVSAPFHCELLKPVAPLLKDAAEKCSWSKPSCQIIANYSAEPVFAEDDIIKALSKQTYMPVLWSDTIDYMVKTGTDSFFELGPGKVLSGLIKRTVKNAHVLSVSSSASFNQVPSFLEEVDNQ